MTRYEAIVWQTIKTKKCGARFRRQVPIGPYIVDFASFDPKLVIEIDDNSHQHRDETHRTKTIESQGFAILRFWNDEIYDWDRDHGSTIAGAVEYLKQGGDPAAVKNWS